MSYVVKRRAIRYLSSCRGHCQGKPDIGQHTRSIVPSPALTPAGGSTDDSLARVQIFLSASCFAVKREDGEERGGGGQRPTCRHTPRTKITTPTPRPPRVSCSLAGGHCFNDGAGFGTAKMPARSDNRKEKIRDSVETKGGERDGKRINQYEPGAYIVTIRTDLVLVSHYSWETRVCTAVARFAAAPTDHMNKALRNRKHHSYSINSPSTRVHKDGLGLWPSLRKNSNLVGICTKACLAVGNCVRWWKAFDNKNNRRFSLERRGSPGFTEK